MPGPKLAVRITIIAFGLMILAGAWLVSTGDPQNPPGTPASIEQPSKERRTPAPTAAPTGTDPGDDSSQRAEPSPTD